MGENFSELKTVIVCSLNDHAGTNIRERLLERFQFEETMDAFDGSPIYKSSGDIFLVSSKKDIIFVDGLDEEFENVRFIFISKHRAESGIPSLTAHFTGNFGQATFGGNPNEIALFSPSLMKNYLASLAANRSRINQTYGITLEATHHGPTALKSSVLFVELGSTESHWVDVETAGIISESLMDALDRETRYEKCAIGIGGTHYPQKLTNLVTDSEYALGPIIPKYALEFLNHDIVDQMLNKSDQEIKIALIDQKGLGKFKDRVNQVLGEFNLEKILI
ncbi:MAG: D-tyrosyl-tRNA(Tyr) deacylase [Thaumarchaeota archaeon]|nr:D-tyrosyl-tRNA(Tyr) deacylase [Nitrososphaerota archaeon]